MNALVWGLPPGDWATWFGSVAVSASLLVLGYGTVKQARETGRQAYLDESAQARLVGASLDTRPKDGVTFIEINGLNASALSVRQVWCFVLTDEPGSTWVFAHPLSVVPPGPFTIRTMIPGEHLQAVMVMAFQDDVGLVWRKYDGNEKRLTRLLAGQFVDYGLTSEEARAKRRPSRPQS